MTKETNSNDLYDFANLDGVPDELAAAVQKERTGRNQELYAAVVSAVSGAPIALGIKQIMVVLIKMGVEVPAESTVRNYLNSAVEAGDIGKPSRQSYWTVESHVEEAEQADDAPAEAPVEEDDILAGLDD